MRISVVVMGVSGCGKSTVAQQLALALGLDFVDGDDQRTGHYMPADLLASQFAALERPAADEADEADVCTLNIDAAVPALVEAAVARLRHAPPPSA